MPTYCKIELNHYEALFLSQLRSEMLRFRSISENHRGVRLYDVATRFGYGKAEILGLFWTLRHKRPPLVGFNYATGLQIPPNWKDQSVHLTDTGLEIVLSGTLPNSKLKIAVPPKIKPIAPRKEHSTPHSHRPGT